MMKTPDWWYRKQASDAPWWRFSLWPLSLIWQGTNAIKRKLARPYRSNLFVISIGNLTLGGSGKTPIAAEIMRLIGPDAVGLSRGHGGQLIGPVLVDPDRHTAAQVGDEPLLPARRHDFVIAKQRAAGLKLIEAGNARYVVVDDAHQNLKIVKDLHILVIDGDTSNQAWPFGDGGVFPYGPMRERFEPGLARADLCVLWMPDETSQPSLELLALLASKPLFVARLKAGPGLAEPGLAGPGLAGPSLADGRVVGFAGIAKPWKFRATLLSQGFDLIDFKAFPDHANFENQDLLALKSTADQHQASLITTEKDWVRLEPDWRAQVRYLPITAQFDDETAIRTALKSALLAHGSLELEKSAATR